MSRSFVADLIDAMPNPAARIACYEILDRYRGRSVYIEQYDIVSRRRMAARHMLDQGMPPADIVEALVRRFRVSSRTIQRDVSSVRKMSLKSGDIY